MAYEKARNTAVGLTIVVAVVLLTWGAFLLGRLPELGPNAPYNVTLMSSSAMGLTQGDAVSLNGVDIGSVSAVSLSTNMQMAKINLAIYHSVKLPTNTVALIGTKYIGTPFVSLYVPAGALKTYLPANGSARMTAKVGSGGLIPSSVVKNIGSLKKDFTALSVKLDRVADDLNGLLKPVHLTAAQATGEAQEPGDLSNVSALVQRLNVTMNSVNRVLANGKLQGQVRQIVANVSAASKQLKTILADISGVASRANGFVTSAKKAAADVDSAVRYTHGQIIALSVRLTHVLRNVDTILTSVAQGHGTAGRIIKDPRLYNSLLVVTNRLKTAITGLDALVRQIKAEGFDLHVGF